MAAKHNEEAGTFKESLEEETEDSFGITSKDFDPMRVIYGPSLGITNENIEVYKSVSQFMQVVNLEEIEPSPSFAPNSSVLISTPQSVAESTNESVGCETSKDQDSTMRVMQSTTCSSAYSVNMTEKPSPQTFVQHVPSSSCVQSSGIDVDQNLSTVGTHGKSESDNGQSHKEAEAEHVSPVIETCKRKERKERSVATVLTKMESGFQHGPLSILRRSVQEKIKVRVWTRSVRNIRGVSTGYVVAFDKHMNLAMMDVDEVYRKPVGKHQKKSKKPEDKVTASMKSSQLNEEDVLYPNAPWQPTEAKSASHTSSLAGNKTGYPGDSDSDSGDNSDRNEICSPADGIGNMSSAFSGMNLFEDNEASRLLGVKSKSADQTSKSSDAARGACGGSQFG